MARSEDQYLIPNETMFRYSLAADAARRKLRGPFRLAAEAAVGGDLAFGVAGGLAGVPLVVLHDAGRQQVRAGEKGRDLRMGAQRRRGGNSLVVPTGHGGDLVGGDVARRMSYGDPTARRHRADEPGRDPRRIIGVGDQVQDSRHSWT